jgi:iron(II)-dependent oxidoreductase
MVAPDAGRLSAWLLEARGRLLDLVGDLPAGGLLGPRLSIVNPPLWEMGHVGWFLERWVLRHAAGRPPLRDDGDSLYDSSAVAHDTRWDLPLPSPDETRAYLSAVEDRVQALLAAGEAERYFVLLALFHEDMHCEALGYTRQTHGWSAPRFRAPDPPPPADGGPCPGDAWIPGGAFSLGSDREEDFVFDNEKWSHQVEVAPFAMARAPVTQGEFRAFVEDGGYRRADLWSQAGWRWREAAAADHPGYWRRAARGWERRHFDRWLPLEPHRPVIHVAWYEAEAFCRWAGRRLPTEAEWEAAARGEPGPDGRLSARRRRHPWGHEPPSPERAHLDWRGPGCADVGAYPAGDSAFGCRQMTGNVWEWTQSDFLPYPGFSADPYRDYSQPWFGTHKVLRGGCFATRGRMIRAAYRNFYTPDRRDVFGGFRTCAP